MKISSRSIKKISQYIIILTFLPFRMPLFNKKGFHYETLFDLAPRDGLEPPT